VGHAIELCSSLKISHGSAVAMGMVVVTRIAVELGLCPSEHLDELTAILRSEGLPTRCEYSASELANAACADKKRSGDAVSLILPYGIGNCKTFKVSVDELTDLIAKGI
jgi:3-dehydroquinate synthase